MHLVSRAAFAAVMQHWLVAHRWPMYSARDAITGVNFPAYYSVHHVRRQQQRRTAMASAPFFSTKSKLRKVQKFSRHPRFGATPSLIMSSSRPRKWRAISAERLKLFVCKSHIQTKVLYLVNSNPWANARTSERLIRSRALNVTVGSSETNPHPPPQVHRAEFWQSWGANLG